MRYNDNKESMRHSHYKERYEMKIYIQGSQNYKIVSRYIDRCLMKHIGKNLDKVKKHIYKKMCYNNLTRHENNIIEKIIYRYIGENKKYILDDLHRVQLNKEYLKLCKEIKRRNMNKILTIVDISKEKFYKIREDITESEIEILKNMLIDNGSYEKRFFNHIISGGVITSSKYNDFIYSIGYDYIEKDKCGYDRYIYNTREYAISCFNIIDDNIVYVFDGKKSSEYKQYKKECLDREHKEKRELKKYRDEYYDNILYSIESEKKKKEEEKNNIDRDRLGFDENSFKGEPYHGKKRKKRNKDKKVDK